MSRNDFSPTNKFFSLHTQNFCKIVVMPFLRFFGINMIVFMPQTFGKKSGALLSDHKTNSGFHSLKEQALLSSIHD